jgi:hypothetical protein
VHARIRGLSGGVRCQRRRWRCLLCLLAGAVASAAWAGFVLWSEAAGRVRLLGRRGAAAIYKGVRRREASATRPASRRGAGSVRVSGDLAWRGATSCSRAREIFSVPRPPQAAPRAIGVGAGSGTERKAARQKGARWASQGLLRRRSIAADRVCV